jgi:hypothetical protein
MDEKKNDQLFTGAVVFENNKQTSLINLIQHEVNIELDQRVSTLDELKGLWNVLKRVDDLENKVNLLVDVNKTDDLTEKLDDLEKKVDGIEQDAIFNDNFSDLFYEEQSNNELLSREDLRDTVSEELDNLLDELKITRQ